MNAPGSRILRLNGWIPYRVFWPARSADAKPAPLAEWCYLGDIRFTEPFFESTMQRAMQLPFRVLFRQQTSMEELEEHLDGSAAIPPTGFIFHMSRCGSTLVAQMLAASPANVVLSEGWAIDSVVTSDLLRPDVTEDQRVRWTRAVIRALGQPRAGSERRYFVKFDCWHTLDLPMLRRAFPDVPWVFVYRDPAEVLVSQLKRPAAWTVPGLIPIRSLNLAPDEALAMPPGEYPARILSAICESALRHAESDGGMLLNYTELPDAVFSRIANHFHCTFSGDEVSAMRDVTQYDAKEPSFYFEPDSARKQRETTPRLQDLSEHWLADVYRRLEDQRLSKVRAEEAFRGADSKG